MKNQSDVFQDFYFKANKGSKYEAIPDSSPESHTYYYNYAALPSSDPSVRNSLGFDHSSSPILSKALSKALNNYWKIYSSEYSENLSVINQTGVQLYLAAPSAGKPLIVSALVSILDVMPSSVDSQDTNAMYVIIQDTKMTLSGSFMYHSNRQTLQLYEGTLPFRSKYNTTGAVRLGDRYYNLTFVPEPSFLNNLSYSLTKYIGVIVCTTISLLVIPICVLVFFLRRLYVSHQIRLLSKHKIVAMNAAQNKLANLFKRIVLQEEKTNIILNA
ncbi:hypothetical protein AKO1_013502, partial [Acrasis kona]